MYTEESVIDTINAKDTGHIEIRTSNRVLKDGVVISTNYHRHVLSPGDDLSTQDPRVQAVAAANWTQEADYMRTQAFLTCLGVEFTCGKSDTPGGVSEIKCMNGAKGVRGYTNFYTTFVFNVDGKFVAMGAWE